VFKHNSVEPVPLLEKMYPEKRAELMHRHGTRGNISKILRQDECYSTVLNQAEKVVDYFRNRVASLPARLRTPDNEKFLIPPPSIWYYTQSGGELMVKFDTAIRGRSLTGISWG